MLKCCIKMGGGGRADAVLMITNCSSLELTMVAGRIHTADYFSVGDE
jgi:hypothetical protein